jgi:hypothetical protein
MARGQTRTKVRVVLPKAGNQRLAAGVAEAVGGGVGLVRVA